MSWLRTFESSYVNFVLFGEIGIWGSYKIAIEISIFRNDNVHENNLIVL